MRLLVLTLVAGCTYAPIAGRPADDAAPGNDTLPSEDGDPGSDAPAQSMVRPITIATGKVTGGPHVEFPLVIARTEAWLRSSEHGGEVASSAGFDITFSQDLAGVMPLAHEIERYVPTTGELVAWVKVPMLTAATTLYLRYGDPSITSSREDRVAVWSAGYAGVWHLTTLDDATESSASTDLNTTSIEAQLATGRTFDGSSSMIQISATTANADVFAGGGSAEAWFFATSPGEQDFGRVMAKGDVSSLGMGDGNEDGSFRFGHTFTTQAGNWRTDGQTVTLNRWTHAAIVYDSSSPTNIPEIYLDGVSMPVTVVTSPSGTATSEALASLAIGDRPGGTRAFAGRIDEARWSRVPRTAGWIATTFANHSDPTGFVVIEP